GHAELAQVPLGGLHVVYGDAEVPALGRVHRDVGVLQQFGAVAAVQRVHRYADAAADVHRGTVQVGRALQHGQQPLGHLPRLGRGADVRQYHRELVAAEARHGVRVAQGTGQPAGDLLQQQVAAVVPEGVVDLLEAV